MGSLGEVALSLQAGGKKGDSGYWGITPFHIYSSLSDQPGSCMLEFVSETGFEDLFLFFNYDFEEFSGGPEGYHWRATCYVIYNRTNIPAGPIPDLTVQVSTFEGSLIGYFTVKVEMPSPAYIINSTLTD